jgi:tetratricopeptide (TPR) repeat protein
MKWKHGLKKWFLALVILSIIVISWPTLAPAATPGSAGRESAAFYLDIGVALYQKGRLDQAIAEFNKAIELNPRDAEAYNYRGSAYLKKGQIDRAISDYDQVLRLKPRYAEVYTDRGVAYGAKGQYDGALADFNRALELNPRYAPAWSGRGGMYLHKGQIDGPSPTSAKRWRSIPVMPWATTTGGRPISNRSGMIRLWRILTGLCGWIPGKPLLMPIAA